MVGERVLHYNLLEKLGGGGMGVVYKAEDTKLHRTVALKFLPPELTRNDEAKQRFINEAQAASSIDHNNICVVHEIGETDDEQLFICMNFYDGETLKKKIQRGLLPIDQAIDIVIQIATGLQKAHSKGIIHRDIKPANIFITNDGIVKILDFGLAKLSGQTMMTRMGSTLGTVAYMSPEQAKGQAVDKRTDIWSLGVVLYEMMTGLLPFRGEFDNAIMYSILNEKPEPIVGLQSDLLPELEKIIYKCLEKDKDLRYQQISELLSDLAEIKSKITGVKFTYEHITDNSTKNGLENAKEIIKQNVWWSAVVSLIVIILFAVIVWPTGTTVKLNPKRTIRTLNLPFKQIMYPSISADGNWIAFPAVDVNGDWNIYLSHSSSGEAPVSLINEKKQFLWSAEISPDGSYVLYDPAYPWSTRIISSSGGKPKIFDITWDDIQWKPDGSRLGGYKGQTYDSKVPNEFWTFAPDGSDQRKEFTDTLDGNLFRNFGFAWSPDGKSAAWLRNFREGSGYQEIFTHNLETGEEKQITFAKSNIEALCWSYQNMIIFSATISGSLNLWMVPADGGELTQITFGDGPDGPPRISKDGRKIIFPKMKMIGQVFTIPITGGEPKLVTAGEQTIWNPGAKISPDGSLIAVNLGDLRFGWSGVESHIYIVNRDGNDIRKLSVGEWKKKYLDYHTWSPDSKHLAFINSRFMDDTDTFDVYILNVAENNQPQKIARLEKYSGLNWIDSLNLNIKTKNKFYTYNLTNNKWSEDTVLYYPIKGKPEVLVQDLSGDWWIMKKRVRHKLKQPENARLSLGNLCWTVWGPGIPFTTISLLDGKVKEYPKVIGPKLFGRWHFRDDGREIVYSTQEFVGQISMIDNPFME